MGFINSNSFSVLLDVILGTVTLGAIWVGIDKVRNGDKVKCVKEEKNEKIVNRNSHNWDEP